MNITGGEAFPFATLEGLMNKLDSRELLQFAEEAEIDTSLESWLEMLQLISDFLDDAEGRQLTERAVKRWLSKLRDLIYDADDIVDVLNTEMLKTRVSDSDVVAGMSSEMKKITKGLKDLKERIKELDLKRPTEIKSNESIKEERITTSLLDHGIVGREKDKEAILNLLRLSPKTTSNKPSSSGARTTDFVHSNIFFASIWKHDFLVHDAKKHDSFHSYCRFCFSSLLYHTKSILVMLNISSGSSSSIVLILKPDDAFSCAKVIFSFLIIMLRLVASLWNVNRRYC
ncbi:Rx, N-terminal [Dillenia turbinata]|uniref:Rx, N-terminal n=1 Tax=Dillenia turbinata TaxID=194707 RepID=A0AAN8VF89_9MAGN